MFIQNSFVHIPKKIWISMPPLHLFPLIFGKNIPYYSKSHAIEQIPFIIYFNLQKFIINAPLKFFWVL